MDLDFSKAPVYGGIVPTTPAFWPVQNAAFDAFILPLVPNYPVDWLLDGDLKLFREHINESVILWSEDGLR